MHHVQKLDDVNLPLIRLKVVWDNLWSWTRWLTVYYCYFYKKYYQNFPNPWTCTLIHQINMSIRLILGTSHDWGCGSLPERGSRELTMPLIKLLRSLNNSFQMVEPCYHLKVMLSVPISRRSHIRWHLRFHTQVISHQFDTFSKQVW